MSNRRLAVFSLLARLAEAGSVVAVAWWASALWGGSGWGIMLGSLAALALIGLWAAVVSPRALWQVDPLLVALASAVISVCGAVALTALGLPIAAAVLVGVAATGTLGAGPRPSPERSRS